MNTNTPTSAQTLHCETCGEATQPADHLAVSTVMLEAIKPDPNAQDRQLNARRYLPVAYYVTRCGSCTVLREQAQALVERWPVVVGGFHYGSAPALQAVEAVLISAKLAGVEVEIGSGRDMRLALEHLRPLGEASRWRSILLEPPTRATTLAERLEWINPGAGAFDHVHGETITAMKRAALAYRVARVERPQPIPHPAGSGCWLCGVGAVETLRAKASTAWRNLRVAPSVFGVGGTERVKVEVCSSCHAGFELIGTVGPTLLEYLIYRAAGVEDAATVREVQLEGVKPWGASGRSTPNATPFAHLDLQTFADQVRAGAI